MAATVERVLFDTNGYRDLVRGKDKAQILKTVERMKQREKALGIEALASPMVARELLSHVTSKSDPAYEVCLNAIYAMWLHCSDEGGRLKIIASYEQLICRSFFNATIPAKEQTDLAIAEMIMLLATKPTDQSFRQLQQNLNSSAEHVASNETHFASSMLQVLHGLDPKAQGWKAFIENDTGRTNALKEIRSEKASVILALAWIYTCYDGLIASGQITPMPFGELEARAKKLSEVFPQPIALYKSVIENMVNSEFNLMEDNRANFIWDIVLMFNVGDHSINGQKLYFITSDKAMIRSALDENGRSSVLKFEEYIEFLK